MQLHASPSHRGRAEGPSDARIDTPQSSLTDGSKRSNGQSERVFQYHQI